MDARVSSPVFIGRSDELARLRAALGEAQGGRSSRYLIGGEAGVGKTRLIAEFSDAARRDGALVLAGGCIDLGEGGVPYAPIVEALRTWVHGAAEDEVAPILGQGRSDLARLVPDLGQVSGEGSAVGSGAQADLAEQARARRASDEAAVAISAGRALHEAVRLRHARAGTLSMMAPQSAAWTLLGDAEASRLEGNPDPDAWNATAGAWETLGRPYPVAYARWREAEAILAAHGDRKEAAEALRAVVATTTAIGAAPLEHEVEALAARARISLANSEPAVPEAPPEGATRLGSTAREREVLALVAAGRTNRQIGEELFISEKTAGVHVSNILGKLGVSGRGEAAAVAHKLGMTGSAAGHET